MDWVILTYGIIFGVIALYLISLWQRAKKVGQALKEKR